MESTPHLVQYQGSKRKLAPQILQYMPSHFNRLIEPFSGMAAISIAVAQENRTSKFLINDINKPLVNLLEAVINNPQQVIDNYTNLWNQQFSYDNHVDHFYDVREQFNNGDESPEKMLYLLARCVKGAVRYGRNGNFNQSPDKRRHGTNPSKFAKNALRVSSLLKDNTVFSSMDYRQVLHLAQPGDLVYMDPPYQGVSNVNDHRYFDGVPFNEFAKAIEILDEKCINYIISYDGECGGKAYGEELPSHLKCTKIILNAGASAQATLLGNSHTTFEALYISDGLMPIVSDHIEQLSFDEVINI